MEGELRYHGHRFPIAPGTEGDDAQAVHARQHYELVNWRVADHGLNYRRFFAVNTLAAIRVEDRRVFDASHVEIRRWLDEGLVDGLRVDHPDGLREPGRYLDDLAGITGGAYVLVEKILHPGEALPSSWATAGTTGYDALALLDRVLTDPAAREPLDLLETRLRGAPVEWEQLVHDSKRAVADGILGSEVRRIVRELEQEEGPSGVSRLVAGAPRTSTTGDLVDAVAELLACFPVYRSYLPEGRAHLDEAFDPGTDAPPRPGRPARHAPSPAVRPGGARGPALPADQRDGDGQGCGGLRVLPLVAADLAQRGRCRSRGLLDHAR